MHQHKYCIIYKYSNPIWNILNHDTVVRFSLDTFLHYHLPDSVVFAHGIVSKSKKEELSHGNAFLKIMPLSHPAQVA